MSDAEKQILIIDDDYDTGEFITAATQSMGLRCIATTTVADFMAALNPSTTLIMIDLIMPEIDGIELLRILGKQQCKSNIILMSGVDKRVLETAEKLTQSLGLSVVGTLQKPFRLTDLEAILAKSPAITTATPNANLASLSISKADLQHAIESNEFVLCYQPQIEIATGKAVACEALVRWQHPVRGLIMPDAFISQAESLGLIDQLGLIIIEKALDESRQFASSGTQLSLSINISPYSLHDLQFPEKIIDLVEKRNLDPANITLEITESGLFNELSSALDIMTRLRLKQFNLAIDDFGTGFAMMQQLRNVPAAELKLDRSLIQDAHQDQARIMIKKIIELGHELGMKIVAEGVGTAEQLEFLRNNRCDLAQGYLFTPPLPLNQLLPWVQKHNS